MSSFAAGTEKEQLELAMEISVFIAKIKPAPIQCDLSIDIFIKFRLFNNFRSLLSLL